MKICSENQLVKFATFFAGALIGAISFNLFLLPNSIVSGFSGLAVIINHIFGWKPSIIMLVLSSVMLVFCYFLLGKETTKKSVVGSILYPLLVEATSFLIPYISFDGVEMVVLIVCGAVINAFGFGLVYKLGFNAGGGDILSQILAKYLKKPLGSCILFINCVIIGIGFLFFGTKTTLYSIIVALISSYVVDIVMIGISKSKSFQIITENETEVKKFLLSKLSHGVTVIPARGGYTGNVVKVIMCIVPTREYVTVKEGILAIDCDALIMVSDVYEVLGNK